MENNVEEPCSFYFADPADVGLVDDGHVEPAESIEESSRSRFDFERDVWVRSLPISYTTGRQVGNQRELGQRAEVLVWEDEE